jgi:hypothetical protein
MMPLALILPLIPTIVEMLSRIVNAAMNSGEATAEQKARLMEIARRLDETNRSVQALEIRQV